MPAPWALIAGIAALTTSAVQTYANIKKARKAKREASEIDVRESVDASGEVISSVYGIAIVPGHQVYLQIGDGIDQASTNALNARGEKFGSLQRASDDDGNEYMLQQWVMGTGPIRGVMTALVNGTSIDQSLSQDGYAGAIVGELHPNGGVDQFARGLISAGRFPDEISENALFEDLAYATTLAWNKRGGLKGRIIWGGEPRLEFIIEGREVKQPDPTLNTGVFDMAVPDGQPISNLVSSLYDYLVDCPTGPKLAASRLDLSDTFLSSWKKAAAVVQGEDAEDSDNKLVLPGAGAGSDLAIPYANWRGTVPGLGLSGLHPKDWDSNIEMRNLLRYEFNGGVPSDMPFAEAITDRILTHAPGTILFLARNGKYKLAMPDSSKSEEDQVDFTITKKDIVKNTLKIIPADDSRKLNQGTIQFADRDLTMAKSTAVWPLDGDAEHTAWLAEDGELLHQTFPAHGSATKYHAEDIIRTNVLMSRRDIMEVEILGDKAKRIEPGHKLKLTVPEFPDVIYRAERIEGRGRQAVRVTARHFVRLDYGWIYSAEEEQFEAEHAGIFALFPGAVVLTGVGVPSNDLGDDGNLYLNSSNGAWYVKTGGVWTLVSQLLMDSSIRIRIPTKTMTSITVEAPPSSMSGAQSYRIRLYKGNTLVSTMTPAARGSGFIVTFTGLEPNTTYTVRANAVFSGNVNGDEDIANPTTNLYEGFEALGVDRESVRAKVPDQGANMTYEWQYDVGRLNAQQTNWIDAGTTTTPQITIRGLRANQRVNIQVRWYPRSAPSDGSQGSGWTYVGRASTLQHVDAPSPFRNVTLAKSSDTTGAFDASWDLPIKITAGHTLVRTGCRLVRDGVVEEFLGEDNNNLTRTTLPQLHRGNYHIEVNPITEDADGNRYYGDGAMSASVFFEGREAGNAVVDDTDVVTS